MARQKPLFLLCLLALPLGLFAQPDDDWTAGLFFDTGKDVLTHRSKNTLDSLVKALDNKGSYQLQLSGLGDVKGDSIANIALANRRIEAVRAYLLKLGLTPQGIFEAPYIPSKARKNGYQLTIRAWFQLQANGPGAKDKEPGVLEDGNLPKSVFRPGRRPVDSLYYAMSPSMQEFCFLPGRDTFFVGRLGTVVFLKGNAVKAPSDCRKSCVTIRLQEVLTPGDMYLHNVSTMDVGGKILESGGMVYLDARCNGIPVKLLRDQTIRFLVPTDKLMPEVTPIASFQEALNAPLKWAPPAKVASPKGKIQPDSLGARGVDLTKFLTQLNLQRLMPVLKKQADKVALEQGCAAQWASSAFHQRYVFEANAFGWHQVEHPLPLNAQTAVALATDLPWDEATDCKLILQKNRVMVPAKVRNNKIVFEGLPANERAVVIATRYKHGKHYLDIQNVLLGQEQTLRLNLKQVTLGELNARLLAL